MKIRIISLTLFLVLGLLLPGAALAADPGDETPAQVQKQAGTASVVQPPVIFGRGTVSPAVSSDTNLSQPRLSYKIQGADDESYSPQVPTAAGVYTVRVIYPETDTHLEAQAQTDFAILSYVSAVSLSPDFALPPRTYDGTQTAGILPEIPLQFTVEGSSQQPRAGQDYELSLQYLSPLTDTDPESPNALLTIRFQQGMYAPSETLTTEFPLHGDILKAPLTVTAHNQVSLQGYDTGPEHVSCQGLAIGDSLEEITLSAQEDRLLPSQARIFRQEQEVTNQYEITYVGGTLSHRAGLSLLPEPISQMVYSGSLQPLLKTPGTAQDGKVLYQLSYQSSQTAPPELVSDWSEDLPQGKIPGIYHLRYKARSLGELPDSEEGSLTLVMAPKVLTAQAQARKVYDGTDAADGSAITVTLDPDQLVPGDQVRVKGVQGSRFPSAQAGSGYKMLPGNVVLDGLDAGSYTVKLTAFDGEIQRRPVTVTAAQAQKPYGSRDPILSYQAEGLVEGDVLTGTLERAPGEAAGTYAITQGTLDDSRNGNYQITFESDTFTIEKAAVSLKIDFSRRSARAGKPLTLTVIAENKSSQPLDQGWAQPGKLKLTLEGRPVEAAYQGGGVWTASVQVEKKPPASLSFRAETEDDSGNYENARVEASLPSARLGANPLTGDQILAIAAIAALSLAALIFTVRSIKKKKK